MISLCGKLTQGQRRRSWNGAYANEDSVDYKGVPGEARDHQICRSSIDEANQKLVLTHDYPKCNNIKNENNRKKPAVNNENLISQTMIICQLDLLG